MGKETDAGCGSVAAPAERHGRPHGCACDFRTYMVGDGCAACNPEKALEFLRDTLDDQADEIDRLREVAARMVAGIDHLDKLAREWEPDHSSGADRRGWLLAKDARDDAARLLWPNVLLSGAVRRPLE